MVVHSSGTLNSTPDGWPSPKRRKRSSTKRRLSEGTLQTKPRKGTVYTVLMSLLCVVAHLHPTYSQAAMDYLFSLTGSKGKKLLNEDDISGLEDSFNVLHHNLDHVFQPFISKAPLKGDAWKYLDMQFLIGFVRACKVTPFQGSVTHPVTKFLTLAGTDRRATL